MRSFEENPSRKFFQLVADVVLDLPVDEKTREMIAERFADALRTTNPRFDRGRFVYAATVGKRVRGNPHHKHERRKYPGATYRVEVWEERDRCHIALWRSWKGNDDMVADWWDEDARQMFEDGFFKAGRGFESSVIAYAKEVGIIHE